MRSTFPLFQSHLDLSHSYWTKLLQPHDLVIDATCGNGKDTLILASLVPDGQVIGIDIQATAIQKTLALLQANLPNINFIQLLQQSHQSFPSWILPQSVALIVYNLGYLPGGNKNLTTRKDDTLTSLEAAIQLIKEGGAISLTCYPGHTEGEEELLALLDWCASLSPKEWSICHHTWINRQKAPSLLFIQRKNPTTFS